MHSLIDCVNYLSVVALMQANILRVTEIISSIVSTILSVVAVMQTDMPDMECTIRCTSSCNVYTR